MPIRIPLAFFCLILSTSAALAQDKKLEPFNFAYASVTGNRAPLWVGRDNGIFEKYGLDLKMVQIGAGSVIVSALLASGVHRCLVAARAGERGIFRPGREAITLTGLAALQGSFTAEDAEITEDLLTNPSAASASLWSGSRTVNRAHAWA